MSGHPFGVFTDHLRAEGERLLELYAQPGTITTCHEAVRDLWEFAPTILAGVLADWWAMSRVGHEHNDEEGCSLVGTLPRYLDDDSPEDLAVGITWDMTHQYPESGRYRLRNFLKDASYKDACKLVDACAELVLKIGDPL